MPEGSCSPPVFGPSLYSVAPEESSGCWTLTATAGQSSTWHKRWTARWCWTAAAPETDAPVHSWPENWSKKKRKKQFGLTHMGNILELKLCCLVILQMRRGSSHVFHGDVLEDLAVVDIPHSLVIPDLWGQKDGSQNDPLPVSGTNVDLCISQESLQINLQKHVTRKGPVTS